MRCFLCIIFPLFVVALFSFTTEEIPEHVLYSGKKGNERQNLSFTNDSLFHITIPNESGCCWTWGECGGRYVVRHDSIDFYIEDMDEQWNVIVAEKETYIKRGDTYHRITPEKFMCKTYNKMKI